MLTVSKRSHYVGRNDELGQKAEHAVAVWLCGQGYTIMARNYRQRCGEVDLIIRKNEIIAFVEVKFRTKRHFATSQVITLSKQQRIAKAARLFLAKLKNYEPTVIRFDVALLEEDPVHPKIEYIPNAFVPNYDRM